MGLLTMDDEIVNWGEHTEVEEINHALMAINSSNELGDQEAQILAYSQAVKKLEAQLVTFQKQQLSLNEKLTFQANEIYEKDEKLKRYRRIGMKAVKEKEQLQKTLDSWKDSSKNLWRLINSGMSSNKDSVGKPLYSRFTKTNDFKGVPHPLSGDYTPTPQEEIDESFAGSIGTSSEHSVDPESEISSVPLEVYVSTPITSNEKGVSDPKSKEVETSCVSHIKTSRQPIKDQTTPKVNRKNYNAMMERELGEGYSFTKKKCFVCGSLSHLIKDCDYYEKKMAREAKVKKQRVVNTGNGVAKPVWTNANRVNHANKLIPRSVQLNAGRTNINSVRANINTGRTNINSVRPNINTSRTNINPVRPRVNTGSSNVNTVRSRQPVPTKTSNSFSPKRPQVNQFNQRGHFSKSYSSVRRPFAKTTSQMSHFHAVKGNWGSAVKTSAGYNWRNSNPNSNCDSGPTFIRTDHPLKNMLDRGIFDSRCSGHMTCNNDQLEDFKEFNGGSVTFGELGHFNLFSISQICDKQHKVLFIETECLVVSSDFKMPDENQILLKVPRHHNMYSFDMKTPTPAKVFACLIAKAASDESKLSDNGTEFKNRDMLEFCGNKGIKQEYSNARTPQQNGVAERMNRVRVTKPQNKTPYELLFSHKPIISYIRPFGCHVTILDTLSVLGKFDGKFDEGFLVDKPNVKGVGYRWMFDIDYLTDSMNYIPVSLENQANPHAGVSEVTNSAGTSQTPIFNASEEKDKDVELIEVPSTVRNTEEKDESRKSSTNSKKEEVLTELQQEKKASSTNTSKDNSKILAFRRELEEIALKHLGKVSENTTTSTPSVNTGSEPVNTGSFDPDDSPMPELEIFHKSETRIFDEASYDEEGVITDFNSLLTEIEEEPKKISEALQDDSWVQSMQEELL
ncbi:ribonuclease H-like domain-containing protein [Tanacetum coccineum]